jgi:hypothetical protein
VVKEWRRPGSNRRPPACKAGALPAELRPHVSSGRPSRCGRRGPFWIRTRDLTVISRALSPAELKARGAHVRKQSRASRDAARPAARAVDVRARSVEPLTSEAWRDLSASDDEDLDTRATVAPAIVVQIPTAHWCASSCAGEPALDPHAAASRYFFAIQCP